MDVTNKTLAMFLVAAIVISLAGTIISLNQLNKMTGYATSDTGTATVNISSTTSITFTTDAIDFGIGSINTSRNNCTMYANASGTDDYSDGCINFTEGVLQSPFVLENDGNPKVSVNLKTDKDAATFLGSLTPAAEFQYAVYDAEAGSCETGLGPSVWTDVNTTGDGTLICSSLVSADTTDTMRIGVRILIPILASGEKTATFTALATGQ